MNQVRTVRLYGVLGARFGRVFRLAVASPAEAIRALCAQLPGLEQYLATSKQRGLTYAVFQGRQGVGEDQLQFNGSGDIRIAPVIIGSKKGGLFQTILGAVLVVVGIYFGQPWLIAMGAGMAFGGVMQMLSPQPKGLSGREDPGNTPSYAFGGPVNTVAMGNPVGLLYGKRRIGGAIISGGIYAEDQM
jgi:predicted phage tail protein